MGRDGRRLAGSLVLIELRLLVSVAVPVIAFLGVALSMRAQSQDLLSPSESVVEAARNARERKANSTKHPRVITNDDLGEAAPTPDAPEIHMERSVPKEPYFHLESPIIYADQGVNQVANLPPAGCDNPRAARIRADLQVVQEDLARVRSELSYQPEVISGRDLNLVSFKVGYSGLSVGAPPMAETQPPAPGRVAEVELEERVASLEKALQMACESPEAARIHQELDLAEQDLNLLQREFALDRDNYYTNPNFEADKAGKARLDAEWQQIESLQSEVQRLKDQLAALQQFRSAT